MGMSSVSISRGGGGGGQKTFSGGSQYQSISSKNLFNTESGGDRDPMRWPGASWGL